MAENQSITILPFEGDDFKEAEKLAKRLGYKQYTYSSTSDLPGLYCLRDRPKHKSGVIIKTQEFGFSFFQDKNDLNMGE